MSTLHQRIATGRYTLPAVVGAAVAVCLAIHGDRWMQTALLVAATYLMVVMNNWHALLRTYSRMVSVTFMLFALAAGFLAFSTGQTVVALSLMVFCLYIFRAYQCPGDSESVFTAFAAVGVASLCFPPVLLLLPLLWMLTAFKMLAMSGRTLVASVLGVVAPYWVVAPYCMVVEHATIAQMTEHLTAIIPHYSPLHAQYSAIDLATVILLATATLAASAHFLHTAYRDKIRTRSIYEMLIILAAALFAFLALCPAHLSMLLPMLTVTVSPIVAHQAALARGRLAAISFYITYAAAIAIALLRLTPYAI